MDGDQTLSIFCWNVFHGRDAPPNKALFTKRSRRRRITEDDGTYVQVNRRLFDEYAQLIASATWDVALLQEFPPSWAAELTRRCVANGHRVLTSRNQLRPLTGALARCNPDLIGANEGGSNMTLVRVPWRIAETRSLLLNPLPRRGLAERRRMGFVRIEMGKRQICVTNLHATAHVQRDAEHELLRAACRAVQWSAGAPLVLAGDFNVRPQSSTVFEELERRYGFAAPTAGDAIDHILVRGLEITKRPQPWPAAARELAVEHRGEPRLLRLSDHAPLQAALSAPMV